MKKTIKIIDLLVNLSNKEKVPKSVKYVDVIFRYSDFHKDYVLYEDENIIDSNTYFVADIVNFNNLNYELEIIEEDKKIEKVVLYSEDDDDGDNNFYITDISNANDYVISPVNLILANKINELIDVVNDLKGKSE